MRTLPRRQPVRHAVGLPLFDFVAKSTRARFTPGGLAIHRRTGLPPLRANLVAQLAGIGPERP